jgi:hypothetical protein
MLCGDDTESLEHVLLTCRSPERTTIWRTTADIWPVTTFGPWPDVTISTILGCGSLSLKPQQAEIGPSRNPTNRNTSQLLHILISEAAHLIWGTTLRARHRWQNHNPTSNRVTMATQNEPQTTNRQTPHPKHQTLARLTPQHQRHLATHHVPTKCIKRQMARHQ